LIDLITNISPTKTPVVSMTASVKAKGTLHEWQTDELASPTANAQIEGNETTATAVTAPTRVTNYCQILDKKFAISETQEVVDKAGRSSEANYQTQKNLKELATDIEYAFVVNSAAASGASGTARQLKGIAGFVTTNKNSATAARALSASIMDDVLKTVWAAGGDPDVILLPGGQKVAFGNTTNFAGQTRNVSTDAAKYSNAIDVYESNFGTLRLVLSHVMNAHATLSAQLFTLEMAKFRKAWLRPVKRTPLAKTGDSQRFLIVAEVTLESLNEKASGRVYVLS
jgi:hypothetical protein